MVEKISQVVDTLKTQIYLDKNISDECFTSFSKITDSLIALKKDAQEASNNYGDTKSITYHLGEHKFHIMATAITGFSVVIFNNDVSIAFRKSKNKVNPSPVMKIEYRVEFLARKGYLKAVSIINGFVTDFLLDTYKVKISEIHLATDIQGYNFTPLDFYKMKTRSRGGKTYDDVSEDAKASAYGGITTFTGFSFGGGDYHLRIYNKTKEITQKKQKGFAKYLLWENKANYNPDRTVWRLEIQIRRAKLKKLVNFDGNTFDDYYNILNGIPDLWNKALNDFTIKDISDRDSFNMLRGFRTLKDGSHKLLTKQAIYSIFKRAEPLSFWSELQKWNTHEGSHVTRAFNLPKSGSFEYVSNSIKSLFSTMAKHYGSVDKQTLIMAFKDANEQNFEKKNISLLEDSFNKQLDWFERIDFLTDNGVLNVPSYKSLEQSIYTTVEKASSYIFDVNYSNDIKERLNSRLLFSSPMVKGITSESSEPFNNYLEALEAF